METSMEETAYSEISPMGPVKRPSQGPRRYTIGTEPRRSEHDSRLLPGEYKGSEKWGETNSEEHPEHSSNSRSPIRPNPDNAPQRQNDKAPLALPRHKAKLKAIRAIFRMKQLPRMREEQKVNKLQALNLITEISYGVLPVQLMGMYFMRDEYGNKRVPVMLNLLKIEITESRVSSGRSRIVFRIELEYADGLRKWVIHRQYKDFLKLHAHFRFGNPTRPRIPRLPKFPKSTLPFRSPGPSSKHGTPYHGSSFVETPADESAFQAGLLNQINEGAYQSSSNGNKNIFQKFFPFTSRKPSATTELQQSSFPELFSRVIPPGDREYFAFEQREKLESYLIRLAGCLVARPEANRLFKFLEISALGLKLAASGGYHGKEGFLYLRDGQNIHKRNLFSCMKREVSKWFIVREGFVVCVDQPDQLEASGVVLVDQEFTVEETEATISRRCFPIGSRTSNLFPNELTLSNRDISLSLQTRNEYQLKDFIESMSKLTSLPWAQPQRFESFAPVRKNVPVRWFVDGRDYFWAVSQAINMAKEEIYIEDWFLSPEIYLRRPGSTQPDWRLDLLLKKKAEEGVKIYVVLYKEISIATPLFSGYAKERLRSCHPNIYVMRHPPQMPPQIHFWAHHEKLLVVDNIVAFVGGIDLCFGRWDTASHVLVDDGQPDLNPTNVTPQIWLGKDYSNTRILDFVNLTKPFEDMIDRTKIPRMPWHDLALQVIGQPARDIARHFIQRWNYLRRQRAIKHWAPYLLPRSDFSPSDLKRLGLVGSCEVQILRSVSPWSIGSLSHVEHSIQNAYVACIESAERFIYIENQFFITSTLVGNTVIENQIGMALVRRIRRAHQERKRFRVVVVLPLIPDFQSEIDAADATAVRIIMHLQYLSICRGENSIYKRLQNDGIDPDDYITFYGLRTWDKLSNEYVTEQVYVHSKLMIVDDRTVILGSANINERSMRGDRDSEIAAIVRDTDYLNSWMAGEQFAVGKFAYTLRKRLMMEHLGVDVDALEEGELEKVYPPFQAESNSSVSEPSKEKDGNSRNMVDKAIQVSLIGPFYGKFRNHTALNNPCPVYDSAYATTPASATVVGTSQTQTDKDASFTYFHNHDASPEPLPNILPSRFTDPLDDSFFLDIWQRSANHNTDVFRRIFKSVPDDNVTNWSEYRAFRDLAEMGNLSVATKNVTSAAADPSMPVVAKDVEGGELEHKSNDPAKEKNTPENTPHRVEESDADVESWEEEERRAMHDATEHRRASGSEQADRDLESLLSEIRGQLVVWPTRFLGGEQEYHFFKDQLAPIDIFT
ncbi:uncharacterized protein VTP21DRAFT_10775 [Calcarisporiella thermophila]|uniref:uncharacterized protein n=1 Tax=Calcarisporiella thermophila TaxID=911321 RepID=UPI003742F573